MTTQGLSHTSAQTPAKDPVVSIIMNCLNGEAYLQESIESALSQSFMDWELILFDDCSTDKSAEIFKSYDDSRLRYIRADMPLDLTAAREAAMTHVRGEWIAFLDQDDIWLPDKLEQQLNLLNQAHSERIGLIYGRAKRFGYIDEGRDFDHHYEGKPLPEQNAFNELALVANFIPMSSAMIRRTAYEAMVAVPDNIRLCPDFYYWMAISQQWQVRALQETCCLYRVRSSDLGASKGIQIFTEFLRVIEYFSDAIPEKLFLKRQKNCHNLIAITEFRNGDVIAAIRRILFHGSLVTLLNQTPAYLFRRIQYRLTRNSDRVH